MKTICRLAAGALAGLIVLAPATAAVAAPVGHRSAGHRPTRTAPRPTTTTTSKRPAAATANPVDCTTDPDNGACTGATPQTGDTWQSVHAKVTTALEQRVKTLALLTASVQTSQYLTSSDQTALESLLSGETQGIDGLLSTVQQATSSSTTVDQLRQDATTMVGQYRVYLVMAPQVESTETGDTESAYEAALTGDEPQIESAIQAAGSPAAAVAAYNDLLSQVTAAGTATAAADLPAVLAVTPSAYPSDEGPLATAEGSLETALGYLKAAVTDVRTIKQALAQPASSSAAGTSGSSDPGSGSPSGTDGSSSSGSSGTSSSGSSGSSSGTPTSTSTGTSATSSGSSGSSGASGS